MEFQSVALFVSERQAHRCPICLVVLCLLLQTTLCAQGWRSVCTTPNQFLSVHFPDSGHGTVVGANGTIAATADGGLTWSDQSFPEPFSLNSVSFINTQRGWIAGDGGLLLRTTDGGSHWASLSNASAKGLTSVQMVTSGFGVAVGWDGGIIQTSDSGASWSPQASHSNAFLHGVSFPDSMHGFAAGSSWTVTRTTDGGKHWNPVLWDNWNPDNFYGISFIDSVNGIAVGDAGVIRRTFDGGVNWWYAQYTDQLLAGVAFINPSVATVVGYGGTILRTIDGGASWTAQVSTTTEDLLGVCFTDADNGTVVGTGGTILHTTTGGVTWIPMTGGGIFTIHSVHFTNSLIGTAAGDSGILHTTDGGWNWTCQRRGFLQIGGVSTTSAGLGIAVNYDGMIYRTTDYGKTWKLLTTTAEKFSAVKFFSADSGFVLGDSIHITSDGGRTFSVAYYGEHPLRAITSPAAGTWIAVARHALLRSTDAGRSWSVHWTGSPDLSSAIFSDSQNGLACGSAGVLLRTSDGGDSWTEITSGISADLDGISYSARGKFWTIGAGGTGLWISNDSGATWIPQELPGKHRFRSIANPGSTTAVIAGDSVILQKSFTPYLSSPPNNFYLHTPALQFQWDSIGSREDYPEVSYTLQISSDQSFTDTAVLRTFSHIAGTDTIAGNFTLFRTYYWRVCAESGGLVSPWSGTRSFYPTEYHSWSVHQLQFTPTETLALAELYPYASDWGYQASPVRGDSARTTVVCIVPPGILWQKNRFLAADTGTGGGSWSGIDILIDTTLLHSALNNLKRGDIIRADGGVMEDFLGQQNTVTTLSLVADSLLGHTSSIPEPQPVPVDSFFSNGVVRFTTGEQYEGSIVTMTGVLIGQVDTAHGIIPLRDHSGNSMRVLDLSSFCTLRDFRDSSSHYSTPISGAHIDTIRGFIHTDGNRGFGIAPLRPQDIVYASGYRSVIRGRIFDDLNRNGIWDAGELPMAFVRVTASGTGGTAATQTAADGSFEINGLPPDVYQCIVHSPTIYMPRQSIQAATVAGSGDTTTLSDVGLWYPWNTIVGSVFNDLNENGVRDSGEAGIPGIAVYLAGAWSDTSVTDSAGYFVFRKVGTGEDSIGICGGTSWEQIVPNEPTVFIVYFGTMDAAQWGYDFSMRKPPADRVKIGIDYTDNRRVSHRTLTFGYRPGATAGIWGVYPGASVIDFSEGEFEIPPPDGNFFDIRFNGAYDRFGSGSWTDIRSPGTAPDTFNISFIPGYLEGGDYPVQFSWNNLEAARHFTGQVKLVLPDGSSTDMKQSWALIVRDRTINTAKLIAQGPVAVPLQVSTWWLVSVPGDPPGNQDGTFYRQIFPLSVSSLFAWSQAKYRTQDTLSVGAGYWLRCLGTIDSQRAGELTMRDRDTIPLKAGWNLVGSPRRQLAVANAAEVHTSPPGILKSRFFGYSNGYRNADTLLPYHGYWIKSSAAGVLILDAGANRSGTPSSQALLRLTADHAVEGVEPAAVIELLVTDAAGATARLKLCRNCTVNQINSGELPPVPPDGVFDARFRKGGRIGDASLNESAVGIRTWEYPVTIRWTRHETLVNASLIVVEEGRILSISELTADSGTTVLSNSGQTLIVRPGRSVPSGRPEMPALYQNYPDPFNPATSIGYQLPVESHVTLTVYTILGQCMTVLKDGTEKAGYHTVIWNAAGLVSGIYFYRMQIIPVNGSAGTYTSVRKAILLK